MNYKPPTNGDLYCFEHLDTLKSGGRQVAHWPTEIGDVLILQTSVSYTVYAVGRVTKAGQTDFSHGQPPHHVATYAEAVKAAKAIVAPRGRIHLLDIDTGEWSEIAN